MKDQNIGLEKAIVLFHNTETFEKLCEHKTAVYIESPAYVYEILQQGLRHGTLRSNAQ